MQRNDWQQSEKPVKMKQVKQVKQLEQMEQMNNREPEFGDLFEKAESEMNENGQEEIFFPDYEECVLRSLNQIFFGICDED